jgi:lipoprotein signal peptidase
MLLANFSAETSRCCAVPQRRALVAQANSASHFSHLKGISIYIFVLLASILLLLLCDPVLLRCNRWVHQPTCAVHAIHGGAMTNIVDFR